jgi:hypothetical protein
MRSRTPSATSRARSAATAGIAATTLRSALRASSAQGTESDRLRATAIAAASAGVKLSGGSDMVRSSW